MEGVIVLLIALGAFSALLAFACANASALAEEREEQEWKERGWNI